VIPHRAVPETGMQGVWSTVLAAYDWNAVSADLESQGWAILKRVFAPSACAEVIDLYEQDQAFRSRVIMARHGFGRGEYKYFNYPLPPLIAGLRAAAYPRLAPLANAWNVRMRIEVRFPEAHADFLARCHAAGQHLPTPLLLKYGAGDYNCLHQDLYGEHVFPLQLAILLSESDTEFTGGEFVLTEQRPRMQTRASVAPLRQGDALIFAVRQRPVRGAKGDYRVNQRHGVSKLLSGRRFTIGIIFHDAAAAT
jgi:uncharacterized protein